MREMEKEPLERIVNMYKTFPEKFLLIHTMNTIHWAHLRLDLDKQQIRYKDNPEKVKEKKTEIEKINIPVPPM